MRVRRKVMREVLFNGGQLPLEREEAARGRKRPASAGEEVNRHRPRDGPETNLEHAGPVDTRPRWIPLQPAFHLIDDGLRIARVTGEPLRTAKLQPVLMPIQLPDDLVIAD